MGIFDNFVNLEQNGIQTYTLTDRRPDMRSSQEQPEAARSGQEQPREPAGTTTAAARTSREQSEAARSSQEQPKQLVGDQAGSSLATF